MPSVASRRWCFTLNNPSENVADYEDGQLPAESLRPAVLRYCSWQLESGAESSTPHIQGYCEFAAPVRLRALRLWLPTAHWEPANGSREQVSIDALLMAVDQSRGYILYHPPAPYCPVDPLPPGPCLAAAERRLEITRANQTAGCLDHGNMGLGQRVARANDPTCRQLFPPSGPLDFVPPQCSTPRPSSSSTVGYAPYSGSLKRGREMTASSRESGNKRSSAGFHSPAAMTGASTGFLTAEGEQASRHSPGTSSSTTVQSRWRVD